MQKSKLQNSIDPLAFILPCALLALWVVVTETGIIPQFLLPKPGDTFRSLYNFMIPGGHDTYSGLMWIHLAYSLRRVLTGFFIAAFFGILLGYLSGRIPIANRIIAPFVHLIRAVPGIGWLPLAIVWFGVGEKNTLFLISLAAFFPVFTNTVHSASEIPNQLILAGQMLGAKGQRLFTSVILPASFPGVAVGLRLALGISWAYLVLGEMTGVNYGLGAVMTDARMLGRVDMVIVCIIVIAAVAKLTDALLLFGTNHIVPRSSVNTDA